jgi:hypothetical protein
VREGGHGSILVDPEADVVGDLLADDQALVRIRFRCFLETEILFDLKKLYKHFLYLVHHYNDDVIRYTDK